MLRYAAAPLVLLCLTGVGNAADAKSENCAASADIVRLAVEERSSGTSSSDTASFLISPEAGISDAYDQAIPALVEWVYALDPALLDEDVAGSFMESCMAYQG